MRAFDYALHSQASEPSVEFLIGMAGKMTADDHAKDLADMNNALDQLKAHADQVNHEIHAQGSADHGFLGEIGKIFGDDPGAGHGGSPLGNGGPSAIDFHHMPTEEAHGFLQAQTSFTHDAVGGDASFGSIMAVMMDYLKMAQKDARDDHEIARDSHVQALVATDAHLQHDNQAIDQGMEQATEKADTAMHSAWAGLATGLVSGLMQIGSGAAAMGSSDNSHSDLSSSGHDNGSLPHFELLVTSDTSHHWPF